MSRIDTNICMAALSDESFTDTQDKPAALSDEHVFALVRNPTESPGSRVAAPRYLDICLLLEKESGSAEATVLVWLWVPEMNSGAGKWVPTATFTVSKDLSSDHGGAMKIDCPRNAAYAAIGVTAITADATLYTTIFPDN